MTNKKKKPEATAGPVTHSSLPPNAMMLVQRLKLSQMERLILRKLADGTPTTMDDIASFLDVQAEKARAQSDAPPASNDAPPPVLKKMSTAGQAELMHDFAEFDADGMLRACHELGWLVAQLARVR